MAESSERTIFTGQQITARISGEEVQGVVVGGTENISHRGEYRVRLSGDDNRFINVHPRDILS